MLFRYYNLFSLQTPHVRRTNTQHLTNDSGRASLYISRKGSMTLEAGNGSSFLSVCSDGTFVSVCLHSTKWTGIPAAYGEGRDAGGNGRSDHGR